MPTGQGTQEERDVWTQLLRARTGGWSSAPATSFRNANTPTGYPLHDVSDAAALCALFAPLLQAGPVCVAQIGQSLDGRIATASGHSHYINGLASRTHLHRLRALVDAVVVGVGTANADRPQLTVRHVEGPHPVRVVLDPRGRALPDLPLFRDGKAPTLHLVGTGVAGVRAPGVDTIELASGDDGFAPAEVLSRLAARGLTRVLVEGGGITVSRFIAAGAVDRLHLMVAPMLIGSGRPGIVLPEVDTLDRALRPTAWRYRCGEDTLFDLVLRPPSQSAPGRLDSSTTSP